MIPLPHQAGSSGAERGTAAPRHPPLSFRPQEKRTKSMPSPAGEIRAVGARGTLFVVLFFFIRSAGQGRLDADLMPR